MEDKTEELIDLVRKCDYLYDASLPEYKNVIKKSKTWADIAEKLNQKVETVKLKWRNLRDSYLKYLKFVNGTPGSAKKFKNWPWASNMAFLRDIVSPRTTISNAPQFETVILEDIDICNDCVATEDSYMPPTAKKLKRKQSSASVHMIKKSRDKKKLKKQSNHLDRIDNLFLSYAETFKNLSPRTQAILKLKMARMFAQAELREMNVQSSLCPPNSNYSSWQTTTVYNDNSPEGMHGESSN